MAIINQQLGAMPGLNPPPVTIHPMQQKAIFQQIMDHLSPQDVAALKAHITPRLIQLLYKAHLPQFAEFLLPVVQAGIPTPVQPNIAQSLYSGIKGQ